MQKELILYKTIKLIKKICQPLTLQPYLYVPKRDFAPSQNLLGKLDSFNSSQRTPTQQSHTDPSYGLHGGAPHDQIYVSYERLQKYLVKTETV